MTDTQLPDSPPPPPPHPSAEPRGEIAGGPLRLALVIGGVVAIGVITKASVLIVILALVIMIFLHELGHFLTAKWSGMKVTEFFIGFGPKLWSFRRGETEYGLKAIPAGAYVRIIGMNNLDECDPADEPRAFRQQSFPKRLLVVSAGSLMHFLQAFVLLVLLLGVFGVPGGTIFGERDFEVDEEAWSIGLVIEDSAAEEAGFVAGDRLVSLGGITTTTFDDVGDAVGPRPGDTVTAVIERDGERIERTLTLGTNEEDPSRGFLGISPTYPPIPSERLGPIEATTQSAWELGSGLKQAGTALGSFFTGGIGGFADQVASGGNATGPAIGGGEGSGSGGRAVAEGDEDRLLSIYGAARIGVNLTDRGIEDLLLFMVSINIFIGVFNLVPLLPLDGGHVVIAIYERIRSVGGRRHMADVSRLLPLTYAFVFFLLLLGVSSLYLDIVDPIGVG
ncbi:MAG: M50 family metallopeptidase [Acidimicrobiales bacterium]